MNQDNSLHERDTRPQEPCFVAEFRLDATPRQRAVAEVRLRLATHIYNRCLQVGLERLGAMRADPGRVEARALPQGERKAAFHALRKRHGLSDYGLQAVGSRVRRSYLGEHIGAHEAQTLATRAWHAIEQHMCGRGGRPRFKPSRRGLDSVEGKGPTSAVRFAVRDGQPVLLWGRDVPLPLRVEPQNPVHIWAAVHVAAGALRYARLVRRRIRGRTYLYAQLILTGTPYPRHETGSGLVGADLGPSTVAVVADTSVALEHFCDALHPQSRRVRRLQRRVDRQHRAGSPGCFDEHGRHRSGRCTWSRSRRGELTAAALCEAQRRMAAHRRSLHGHLVNRILSHGTDLRIELLSYRAWQRGHFSRSVRDRAPGLFVSLLRRKAESAGGGVVELNTWATALSQVCVCGRRKRKTIRLREHRCECGVLAQRDVFSALLARHVDPRTHALDAEAAAAELRSRHDIAGQTASSTGLNRRLEWHSAARTEASVGAGRPHPARSSGEAA